MLKKIRVDQVCLGMHLHSMEGAWMDHPFWKTRFVLREPEQLKKLHDSAIVEVWIDTSKGLDAEEPTAAAVPAAELPATLPAIPAAAPAPLPEPARAASVPVPAPSKGFAEEMHAAAGICHRAKAQVEKMFDEARLGRVIDAEACMPLVREISDSVFRNPGALVSLSRLKTQDDYSYMHSVAVCALMVAFGREIGLDVAECRLAGAAGLLHDVGKAMMPLEILNKPGALTDAEYSIMKTHPERGHELLVEARGADPVVMDVCLHHHERFDGAGYPHRLPVDKISRFARMGSICDVYDAVTSNRPYKVGWDPAESIGKMASWKGQFDPALFAGFVQSVGIYPTGSLVKLQSDRLAVVLEQNHHALTSPVVKVFFSLKSNMPVSVQRLDLAGGTHDRIAGREAPEKWNFAFLDQLWAGDMVPH